MKVNQIVSEHKKGVRAMKYTKKTKGTVPVYGPEANNGKLKPVKPTGPVSESEVTLKPMPGAQEVDIDGKAVGTATTPAAATAIADLAKKGEFTPANPDGSTTQPTMEVGDDVKGDKLPYGTPTDTREVFYVAVGNDGAPRLKVTDSPNVDSLPKIVRLPKLDVPGYDIASKGFRAINIELPGSKQRVGAFMSGQYVYADSDTFNKLQQALQARSPEMTKMRESDDSLLEKMRTIAGLR